VAVLMGPERTAVGSRVRAHVALTKPRIVELLLATALPTAFLAAGGLPPLWPTVAILVGGTLAAGSANTFNSVYDRDIDAVMGRTYHRPAASGQVGVRAAIAQGVVLAVLSAVVLALMANLLAAALGLAAIAFYAIVYTMVLKRRTPQNIVWGGAAGCMPVLIAWAAITGTLTWTPVVLFLVVFFWTPPHYWPLAMRFRDDYAAAGVPMLPVVADDRRVTRDIVAYGVATVVASLVLIPIAPMGWVYGVGAGLLGAAFLWLCLRLRRAAVRGSADVTAIAMRLFHGSITYLALLFLLVAIDPFLG
jgi:protoheme IX farnesyltransferase